jgi:hypothetical protein
MRFAVWPSQRGGMRPALPFPGRVSRAAATIWPGSVPTSRFVPWEMGDGALRVIAQRKAGDAESRGLFLDATRIGEDELCFAQETEKIEVPYGPE